MNRTAAMNCGRGHDGSAPLVSESTAADIAQALGGKRSEVEWRNLSRIPLTQVVQEAAKAEQIIEALLARVQDLVGEAMAKVACVEARRVGCTCRPFRRLHIEPHHAFAEELYSRALVKEQESKAEFAEKTEIIKNIIHEILIAPKNRSKCESSKRRAKVTAISTELLQIKDISVQDIMRVFNKHKLDTSSYPDLLDYLCRKLGAARMPLYLQKLLQGMSDIAVLNLSGIWREKSKSRHGGRAKKEKAAIAGSGEKANQFCKAFFAPNSLHTDIEKINDLEELQAIVTNNLPDTPDGYHRIRSSVAKIYMMHLAETIASEIDLHHMKVTQDHLDKRLKPYVRENNGKIYLTSRKKGGENKCRIASFDTPQLKELLAIARKFADHDTNTNDFKLGDIGDVLRFRIELLEKDSKDPKKRAVAIKKLVAILVGILGTDIASRRLRNSLDTGRTNPHSTGKHQAFQFTISYRPQCRSNGKKKDGTYRVKRIPVEIQIVSHMNLEERGIDHKDYKRRKDEKIQRFFGVNVEFTQFICDSVDYILKDFDSGKSGKNTAKTVGSENIAEAANKEKLACIIFRTISNPQNQSVLESLLQDTQTREKLSRIIEKYKNPENIPQTTPQPRGQKSQARTTQEWQIAVRSAIRGVLDNTSIAQLACSAESALKKFCAELDKPGTE